jgi:hypothetical protein
MASSPSLRQQAQTLFQAARGRAGASAVAKLMTAARILEVDWTAAKIELLDRELKRFLADRGV